MPTELIIITVDYACNITVCSLALKGLLCIQNMHSSKYFCLIYFAKHITQSKIDNRIKIVLATNYFMILF